MDFGMKSFSYFWATHYNTQLRFAKIVLPDHTYNHIILKKCCLAKINFDRWPDCWYCPIFLRFDYGKIYTLGIRGDYQATLLDSWRTKTSDITFSTTIVLLRDCSFSVLVHLLVDEPSPPPRSENLQVCMMFSISSSVLSRFPEHMIVRIIESCSFTS